MIDERATVKTGYKNWIEERRGLQPCGEVDFGVNWTDGAQYPRWRVSWIPATGELYAREQIAPDRARFILFGVFKSREQVESALKGWADSLMSLDWIRERTMDVRAV